MKRLTEIDPCWLGEECWTKACRVGDDMIDAVYKRLWEYENIGSTPDEIVKTLWNAVPVVRCEDCVFFCRKHKPKQRTHRLRWSMYENCEGGWHH